ncbi:MAG: ribonuclease [Tenuifilum sp.]|nr:ribonuclease [Tenuifilum sp.]
MPITMLEACLHKDMIEAGCDEAGRGCLAGPVFAAAVILPNDFNEPLINDSKLLTHKQREKLREVIEHYAVDWAVAMVSNQEIDEINILNASILAMHRAIESLKKKRPQHLLIDGNRFKPYSDIPHTCIVKGDSKFLPIAAASILAKTHRDEFMTRISKEYPYYQWEVNKGYPTKKHREGIAKNGISPYHRKSFKLL